MDVSAEGSTLPQKEGTFPEKPLESPKRAKKTSKFKSIFTKSASRTKLPQGTTEEGTGEGDTEHDTHKDHKAGHHQPQPNPKKSIYTVMDSSSTNLVNEPEAPVLLRKDPFLVGGGGGGGGEKEKPAVVVPKPYEIQIVHKKNSPTHVVLPMPQPTRVIPDDRTPQRPQPQAHLKLREQRKSATSAKGAQRQDARKGPAKNTSDPVMMRSRNEHIEQAEPRTIKRRSAKLKEKAKARELLCLVEELAHNCEYYKNALKRKEDRQEVDSYQLRKENESLNLQIFKLGQEIEEWREKCLRMENKSTALSKAKSLSKENKELLDDIEVLKSVICRLNRELLFYQDKLRSRYKDSPENIANYSTSSGTEVEEEELTSGKGWLMYPRKSLLPLLIAYDEVIAEKEEIIRDHELTLDKFKSKCLDVVRENGDLHKLISDNKDRGSISIDEWESLRLNAVLVLEENDLLHDQIDNLKRKEEKLFSTFQEKAAGFKQTIAQLESELGRQVSAVSDLDSRCKRLTEENTSLSDSLQNKVPREKHESMIQEFKQAFEDLKVSYDSDKKTMSEKVSSLEKERERLVGEVASVEAENTRLRGDVRDCENNLAASNSAFQKIKTSLLEQSSAREATNSVIEDFMKHVEQLVSEKNKLLEDLSEQKSLNEQIMALRSQENKLVADLHGKIEAMERLHNEEVKQVQQRVKEKEDALKAQNDRHRRENSQFNELLQEKEKRIESIQSEKRQLQQDLETVWKTTTTTMQNTIKSRQN